MTISHKKALFEQQFQALYTFAYRYVVSRISSPSEAEDIVAQACTEAYARLEQYDAGKGVLQQWLTGILRFKIIDYWRQKKITVSLDDVVNQIDLDYDPKVGDRALDQKILFQKIMEQLPKELQLLCTLRYVDDLTYEQIAEVVGRKATTVRKVFSDLHKKLRLQFSEEFLGEDN